MEKEFVEIAGVKWATKNVGAEKETDTGLYFQWGDAQGYAADDVGHGEDENDFTWESYKYGNGTILPRSIDIPKYNYADDNTVLEASDDAVAAAWGDGWRTPTIDEFIVLRKAVNTEWTYDYKGSGVAGLVCTDKTDSSKTLFFPACGDCYVGSVYNVGMCGTYWSSSLLSSNILYAYSFDFNHGYVYWQNYFSRHYGFPVRGVYEINLKRKLWIKNLLK